MSDILVLVNKKAGLHVRFLAQKTVKMPYKLTH